MAKVTTPHVERPHPNERDDNVTITLTIEGALELHEILLQEERSAGLDTELTVLLETLTDTVSN